MLEAAVRSVALYLEDDLLDAAQSRPVAVDDLSLPALALGVPHVHPVEVRREQPSLLSSGPGADLDDHVLVVIRVLRQQRHPQLVLYALLLNLKLG